MVGTTITVGAAGFSNGGYLYYDNTATNWENVYAYYGKSSGYNWAKMVRVGDSQLFRLKIGTTSPTPTPSYDYGDVSSAFFADKNYNNSNNGVYGGSATYSGLTNCNKTVQFAPLGSSDGNLGSNTTRRIICTADADGTNARRSTFYKTTTCNGSIYVDVSEWTSFTDDTIYMYYGQDEGSNTQVGNTGWTRKIKLERIVGTNIFEGKLLDWDTNASNPAMVGYFISEYDYSGTSGELVAGEGAKNYSVEVIRNSVPDGKLKTKLINKNLANNQLIVVENDSWVTVTENYVNTDKYAYINATLYNYLYNGANGDIYTTATNWQKDNDLHFSQYNQLVANWYKSQVEAHVGDYTIGNTEAMATPLYQGNFRRETFHDYQGTLGQNVANSRGFTEYNFVSVANGANRATGHNGETDSTHAVGMNLVDKKMKDTNSDGIGDTLVQYGIEVPQFSDKFTTKNSSLQWSDNITFPMDKEYTFLGEGDSRRQTNHIRYYYRASNGANRYYDATKNDPNDANRRQMQVGGNISTSAGNGYFPFNKTQPDSVDKLINGFGTRFDIEFVMPEGRMLDYGTADAEELDFTFWGDDDVWVFIDGYLALDMGGQHNNAKGSINLTKGTFTLTTGFYDASFGSVGTDNQYSAGEGVSGTYGSVTKTWAYGTSNANNSSANYFSFNPKLEEVLSQTNQKHTLTVFYMERGEWDSNFRMEYMLPAITQSDNEVVVSQKVNGDAVNDGLRLKTMEVANKDVFVATMGTQYMNMAGVSDNIIKLPVQKTFTRRTQLNVSKTSPSQLTLQQNDSSVNYNGVNGTSGATYTSVRACYSWTDDSHLLDDYGNEVTPAQRSATNSGVGLPHMGTDTDTGWGLVPLLYGQTATFFNQFSTKLNSNPGGAVPSSPIISISQKNTIYRFVESDIGSDFDSTYHSGIKKANNTQTDTISVDADKTNGRFVDDYYTTHLKLTGCYAQTPNGNTYELNSGDECYLESNKVRFDYEHDIRVGSVTIKKEVEGDDKDANGIKTEYTFEISYRNLFGETDTTATLTTPNKDVTKEDWKTADLVGTRSGLDAEDHAYTSENNTLVAYDGRFGMVAGSEVRFDGIPVGTMIQIREYSENNPKTGEASTIGKVLFSGTVAENLRIDGTVGTWSTKTNESLGVTVDVNATLDNEKKTLLTAHSDTYKMVDNKNWIYNFTNSFANIPVLYRYIDRKVEDGKPTGLNDGYTYFTKGVTLPYNELLERQKDGEGHDIADTDYGFKLTKTITDDAKINVCDLSPKIVNVICTYDLSYTLNDSGVLTGTSQYYPNQELEYADRKDYYSYNSSSHQYDVNPSKAGTPVGAFELRNITNELNIVLSAMKNDGTFNDTNSSITEDSQTIVSYKSLAENLGNSDEKGSPVGLKDTLRNILERAANEWKQANPNDALTKDILIDYLKNYFYFESDKYYVIQATYTNSLRLYDVDIQFYAPTTGIDTNNDDALDYQAGEVIQIKYGTPFNGLSSLAAPGKEAGNTGDLYTFDRQFYDDTSRNIITALDLDETSNELFRIKLATGKYAYFAYWERQVSYNDGDQLTTEWIPVSTNFNYHYRVNDHVRIRAVYQIESNDDNDDNDGKRYNGVARDGSGNFKSFSNSSEFKYIDDDTKQMSSLYEPLKKNVKYIYWIADGDGNRKYRTKTDPEDGPFTGNLSSGGTEPTADDYSSAPSNPLYVEEQEPIGLSSEELDESSATGKHAIALIKEGADGYTITTTDLTDQQLYQVGYNVPNSTGDLGYTTSSTDKTYNSYTTEVLNSTTNQYEKQDRTRVDIMFGTPTSDNEDNTIDYVGYVLYRSPKYDDASEAKYGIVDNLRSAITSNGGTINSKLNTLVGNLNTAKESSDPDYKKQTLSTTYADAGANGDNKTYTAVYSLAPVTFDINESGNGKIYLTNKNRYNVVFSLKNDEEARKYYYTAFLVTVRNGKYYVSDSPATFCLSEADPAIKDGDGQRSYTMILKNCLATDNGDGSYAYTEDKPYVGAEMCNYTTAVNGRELSFTTRTYTWVDPNTHIPYTGELKKLTVGNKAYTGSEIEKVKTGGTKKVTFNTTTTDFINDPVNTSSFTVKAYFERIVLGCSFTINQKANTSVRTTVVGDTGSSIPSFSKIYGTASADTSYDHVQIVPYNGRLKVTVKVPDGFVIDDRNSVINTLIEQGKIIETLSTDKKTWTAEVDEVYKLKAQSDGSNSDASVGLPYTYATCDDIYEQLLANLPGAVEPHYTLTVTAAAGNDITFNLGGEHTVSAGTSEDFTFTASQVGSTITFTATPDNNHTTPITWIGVTSIGTDTDTATLTLSDEDITVTATPKSKGIKLTWNPNGKVSLDTGYSWGVYYWDNGDNGTGDYMIDNGDGTFKFTIPTNCKFKVCMLDGSGNRRNAYEMNPAAQAGTNDVTITATGWTTNSPPMINYTQS